MRQAAEILSGEVVEILPNTQIRVELSNGSIITASISGKLKMNNVEFLAGDKVDVELSPYDMTIGKIVTRY